MQPITFNDLTIVINQAVNLFLVILMIVMVFDVMTGTLKAIHNEGLRSRPLSKGIIEKLTEFLLLLLTNVICALLIEYTDYDIVIRSTGTLLYTFLIGREFYSVLENVVQINDRVPSWFPNLIKKSLEKLTTQGNELVSSLDKGSEQVEKTD